MKLALSQNCQSSFLSKDVRIIVDAVHDCTSSIMNGYDMARVGQSLIDVTSGLGGKIKGHAAPAHETDRFEVSISFCSKVQLPCHFVAWTVLKFTTSPL